MSCFVGQQVHVLHPYLFKKGHSPPRYLAENVCVQPQTPPGSKSKSWQMGNFWPKDIVKARGEHSQMDQL